MKDVLGVEGVARALAKDLEREWAFNATYARSVSVIFKVRATATKNITLSLHYVVSVCKGRRESLVDDHTMCDVLGMGNVG